MIYKISDTTEKEYIATKVLTDLPEWFGLPDSTNEYINVSRELPFWVDREGEEVRGFITLKETSPYTVEVYVMGVMKKFQRAKIGEQLFQASYNYAKEQGYLYMQVKTVKEGCYKEYDQTVGFYKKMGFKEFECFPTLWDEWNPCQVFVRGV